MIIAMGTPYDGRPTWASFDSVEARAEFLAAHSWYVAATREDVNAAAVKLCVEKPFG